MTAIEIPARQGVAALATAGQIISVINTHGGQVVDTWAFDAEDMGAFMSMEHSRVAMLTLFPKVGDTFRTNRRDPILTVVEDTTPGVHDMLVAACDRHRYRQLGAVGYHDSCADNLHSALATLGRRTEVTPAPLNLFMNVPVAADGSMKFLPPVSAPGQLVALRAERDIVIVFSACPQDMIAVNATTPTEAHFTIR